MLRPRHSTTHRPAGDRGLRRPLRSRRSCSSLAREFDLGGVILFARNVDEPEQVAELSREARGSAAELPLWVSVDQEGGRVARLKAPFTEWPPMATLGRSGDEALAERFARALAASSRPSASRSTTRRFSTSTPIRRTR